MKEVTSKKWGEKEAGAQGKFRTLRIVKKGERRKGRKGGGSGSGREREKVVLKRLIDTRVGMIIQ